MLSRAEVDENTRRSTLRAEVYVEKVRHYLCDAKKEERRKQCLCRYCFYFARDYIAGQAFTNYICENCKEEHTHPNTHRPHICCSCSDMYSLCRQCGGDIG